MEDSAYTVSRGEDEEAWFAARRTVVTASEAQHVLQVGYFAEPWADLAAKKLSGERLEDNEHMAAGRFWEEGILRYFGAVTGFFMRPADLLLVRPEIHMGATPDGQVALSSVDPDPELAPWLSVVHDGFLLEGEEAQRYFSDWVMSKGSSVPVEVKNQRSKARSKWNKPAAPPGYEAQSMHQRVVLEAPGSILAAKVDANELYVHLYDPDPFAEEELLELCAKFHEEFLAENGK